MEEKSAAREYPPRESKPEPKKQNGFIRFLKFVFVKDIALKAAALLTGAALWLLIIGLS
ncbi:MAG: hypothetical protein FWH03_07780 [Firmicutes bacterium]|nr:hypothetical protein [Bacillota bacterium]